MHEWQNLEREDYYFPASLRQEKWIKTPQVIKLLNEMEVLWLAPLIVLLLIATSDADTMEGTV